MKKGFLMEHGKDKFKCSFRRKQPAKNKGLIEMYFVETAL